VSYIKYIRNGVQSTFEGGAEVEDVHNRELSFMSVRAFQSACSSIFATMDRHSPFEAQGKPARHSSCARLLLAHRKTHLLLFVRATHVVAEIKGLVAEWRKAYVAKNPAQVLPDMAETLPLLYTAVMSMSGWGLSKRLQCWGIFLLRLVHGLRASSLAQYCPVDIRLPPKSARYYDKDGKCA
jgi:hypothetical protein